METKFPKKYNIKVISILFIPLLVEYPFCSASNQTIPLESCYHRIQHQHLDCRSPNDFFLKCQKNMNLNLCQIWQNKTILSYHKKIYCFGNICYHIYPLQLIFPLWEHHHIWNFKKTREYLWFYEKIILFFLYFQS